MQKTKQLPIRYRTKKKTWKDLLLTLVTYIVAFGFVFSSCLDPYDVI